MSQRHVRLVPTIFTRICSVQRLIEWEYDCMSVTYTHTNDTNENDCPFIFASPEYENEKPKIINKRCRRELSVANVWAFGSCSVLSSFTCTTWWHMLLVTAAIIITITTAGWLTAAAVATVSIPFSWLTALHFSARHFSLIAVTQGIFVLFGIFPHFFLAFFSFSFLMNTRHNLFRQR